MKYSTDRVQEICKYIRAGNNYEDSAGLSDISERTFYDWKKNKPQFLQALKKAEQECKARNIAIVQRAAETTWTAAAWWLERKYSKEFALRKIVEGDPERPLGVVMLPAKYDESKLASPSRPTDGSSKKT